MRNPEEGAQERIYPKTEGALGPKCGCNGPGSTQLPLSQFKAVPSGGRSVFWVWLGDRSSLLSIRQVTSWMLVFLLTLHRGVMSSHILQARNNVQRSRRLVQGHSAGRQDLQGPPGPRIPFLSH